MTYGKEQQEPDYVTDTDFDPGVQGSDQFYGPGPDINFDQREWEPDNGFLYIDLPDGGLDDGEMADFAAHLDQITDPNAFTEFRVFEGQRMTFDLRVDLTGQEPNMIYLSDLPQVPDEEIDAPHVQILASYAGPLMNVASWLLELPNGENYLFSDPKRTKFVLVLYPGDYLKIEMWNPNIHGEWEAIRAIEGLTPAEFAEVFTGARNEEIPGEQHFENVRKRASARKKAWPVRYHPPVKKT